MFLQVVLELLNVSRLQVFGVDGQVLEQQVRNGRLIKLVSRVLLSRPVSHYHHGEPLDDVQLLGDLLQLLIHRYDWIASCQQHGELVKAGLTLVLQGREEGGELGLGLPELAEVGLCVKMVRTHVPLGCLLVRLPKLVLVLMLRLRVAVLFELFSNLLPPGFGLPLLLFLVVLTTTIVPHAIKR